MKRRLAVLVVALVVIGSAIGTITAQAIVARNGAADEVRIELLPAQARVDEVYNGLIDEETGVRGYVLTGDEGFLEPYAAGRRRADAALAGLRTTFDGDAEAMPAVDRLTDAIGSWRTGSAEPDIAERRAGTQPDRITALAAKQRFDGIRAAIRDLHRIIDDRIDRSQADTIAADRWQTLTLVAFAVVMVGSIVAAVAALIHLVTRPIDRLRRHVRHATDDLAHPIPGSGPPELAELATDVEALRVRLRDAITKANAMLAAMGDSYAFTVDGRIIEVNDRLCEVTGFDREELVGASRPYPFWPPEEVANLTEAVHEVLAAGRGDLQVTLMTRAGARFPASLSLRQARTDDGELLGWVATMRDISEFKRREEDLHDIASRDSLTGLFNRRAIDDHLENLVTGDAVVAIDLDHFKEVNDNLGHAAGDEVLRRLSRTLTAHLRGDDWAGRLGGEEFVLTLAGVRYDAHHIVERLRRAWLDTTPETTFSAGIAIHSRTTAPRVTLARADEALYAAKRLGRNRVEVWSAMTPAGADAPER